MPARTVKDAIRQKQPFRHLRQEAVVALLVTADAVRRRFDGFFAARGEVTFQQYNVLRILRGAEPGGLPTLDIAERMLERTPGITRLLDRLEAKHLVSRQRGDEDRRQVRCRVTAAGLELLAAADAGMDELDDRVMASLDDPRLRALIDLLDQVRMHQDDAG